MWRQKRVAVVIPAFNEQARIGATLAGIPAFVDDVVVVDDCSKDETRHVVQRLAEPRLALVVHDRNRGVGAAICSGYRKAMEQGADILVVMAADNQMHPDDLEPLLQGLSQNQADYAKGNRFLHEKNADMPRLRKWGSRFLSLLTRLTTGYAVDDCQCGFTALDRRMAERLPLDDVWPRYGYPNDMLALLRRLDAKVVDVPVRPIYAGEASGLHAGYVFSIAVRIIRRWLERPRRLQSALKDAPLRAQRFR